MNRTLNIRSNPYLADMLAACGLTLEDVEQFGPQNRAGYDHRRQAVPRHLAKVFATRNPRGVATTSSRSIERY
ncbi:MAG: hypothetical protein SFX73_31855 [Kofleriaceae bacterium]|nr:hypothetical protein [Kofleriaceae bacterium]